MLAEESSGATQKALDVGADPVDLDKKVTVLAATSHEQILAPYGLGDFSIDFSLFDEDLSIFSMMFFVFVDVICRRAIDLSHSIDVISRFVIDKTHQTIV